MQNLTASQLRRALGELAELTDLAEYPERTAQLLRRLIPCDVASYNAVDTRTRRATIAADPADSVFDGAAEGSGGALRRHASRRRD